MSFKTNAAHLIDHFGEKQLSDEGLLHYLEYEDLNKTIYNCKGEDIEPFLYKAKKHRAFH